MSTMVDAKIVWRLRNILLKGQLKSVCQGRNGCEWSTVNVR